MGGTGRRDHALRFVAAFYAVAWIIHVLRPWTGHGATRFDDPWDAAWLLLTPTFVGLAFLRHPDLMGATRASRMARILVLAGSLTWLLLIPLRLLGWGSGLLHIALLLLTVVTLTAGLTIAAVDGWVRATLRPAIAVSLLLGTWGFLLSIDGAASAVLTTPLRLLLTLMAALGALTAIAIARDQRLSTAAPPAQSTPVATAALTAATILGLVSPLIVGVISLQAASALLGPDRETSDDLPTDHGIRFENVSFASRDGTPLHGWWMGANSTAVNGCTILFIHGWSDHLNQSLEVAPFLHRAGYNVFAFDLRGHGKSGGRHTTLGLDEVQDAQAAVDVALQRAGGPCLGAMGYSMGAATALRLASIDPRVQAVVADSAFARIQHLVNNVFTYETCKHLTCLPKYPFGPFTVTLAEWITGRPIAEAAPVEAVPGLDRPALLIQGEEDFFIDEAADGQALKDAIGEGAQLWMVPGATHVKSRTVAGADYETRVRGFFDAALRAPAS